MADAEVRRRGRLMSPEVTVVLIVRNGERFVAEALESVTAQTLRPHEILVIDGHSTDRTMEIVRRMAGVTAVTQTSSGIANAYNEGIRLARGEFIAFISHDDRWLPEKLARQAHFMASHPETLLCVTHVQHVLEEGAALPPGFRAELLDGPVPGFLMEALMVRRSVFDRVGTFDPSFTVSEDTDWFARVKDAGLTIGVVPDALVQKRVHNANASLQTPQINALLLRALRGSIQRKRASGSGG